MIQVAKMTRKGLSGYDNEDSVKKFIEEVLKMIGCEELTTMLELWIEHGSEIFGIEHPEMYRDQIETLTTIMKLLQNKSPRPAYMRFFKDLEGVPDRFFWLFERRDTVIGAKYVV